MRQSLRQCRLQYFVGSIIIKNRMNSNALHENEKRIIHSVWVSECVLSWIRCLYSDWVAIIVCLLCEIALCVSHRTNITSTLTFRRYERMCFFALSASLALSRCPCLCLTVFVHSQRAGRRKAEYIKVKSLCSNISFAFNIWQCSDSNEFVHLHSLSTFSVQHRFATIF